MKLDYGITLSTEDQRRMAKEVLPLLKSLGGTDGANYTLASNLIMHSVVTEGGHKLSLVDDLIVLLASALSVRYLPGYATLDTSHITQVLHTIETIRRYTEDLTQKRPLNFLMLAAPGAGKSHFIKCLASKLTPHKVSPITFNMAGMQSSLGVWGHTLISD